MALSDYVDLGGFDNALNINLSIAQAATITGVNLDEEYKQSKKKIFKLIVPAVPKILKEDEFAKAHALFEDIPISHHSIIATMAMAGGDKILELQYMEKLSKGRQLIEYTLYYLTDPESKIPEDFTMTEKKIINAIADNISPEVGKIFVDCDLANLENYFPAEGYQPMYTGEYLFTQDDIDSMIPDNYLEKMRTKWNKSLWDTFEQSQRSDVVVLAEGQNNDPAIPVGGRFDADGMYYPIFTLDEHEKQIDVPVRPEGMSDLEFKRYELVFSGMIPEGVKHYYSYDMVGNTYITTYTSVFDQVSRMIDNGRNMGGSHVWIVGNYCNPDGALDYIFIDCMKHPDIAKATICNPIHVLENDEANQIFSEMMFGRLYQNIDLTDTPFLDNIVDTSKFEQSVNYVLQILDMDGLSDTRLRFESYDSPCFFTLVSDTQVHKSVKHHCQGIVEGLKFRVEGDKIYKLFNGKELKYELR